VVNGTSEPYITTFEVVKAYHCRFCADSRQDPDVLLSKLTSADVKSWFDWIENNFSGSIKAHGTLSSYWRTLKRLYFMKNKKNMRQSMVNDCTNVRLFSQAREVTL
jgi:hypothetical protein